MGNILKYSVLRYSPSVLSGESINLGVLFQNEEDRTIKFVYTTKWTRIHEFDDELDIDILKVVLESIREQVEPNLLNVHEPFSIESFIKYYTNEMHFSNPISIYSENINYDMEEAKKIYLRFDYEKSERLSRKEEFNFLASIFRSQGIEFKKRAISVGSCNEKITYDYLTTNYGIKLFQFKDKDLKKVINDVKAWAWNSEKNSAVKTLIVYSSDVDGEIGDTDYNSELFKIIIKIFEASSTQVFRIDDMSKVVDMLTSDKCINKVNAIAFQ